MSDGRGPTNHPGPPTDELLVWIALLRQGSGGSSGLTGNFQVITSSQAVSGSPGAVTWLLVDTTAAPITLTLPSIANSTNRLFTIVDRFNTSSSNPISLAAPATTRCWDFQNPGSYAQTVAIADPTGSPTRIKYDSVLNLWLPW